ncbi:hypothetical protein HJG60_008470 [Phyllostomus discolor]|uniref:Uncharacterized protein n=1 Tax=Phyllostomus discolor TaxID=89673 RepID=A0A833Z4A9_9CHIR|nr:hypothetical protein HJG60_008470 [Phyllostomus discolor]
MTHPTHAHTLSPQAPGQPLCLMGGSILPGGHFKPCSDSTLCSPRGVRAKFVTCSENSIWEPGLVTWERTGQTKTDAESGTLLAAPHSSPGDGSARGGRTVSRMCCGTDVGPRWEAQKPSSVSLRSRQWHFCDSSGNRTPHVAPQRAPLWSRDVTGGQARGESSSRAG